MTLFNAILTMTVIGSIEFLVFMCVEPITKRFFRAAWHYRTLKFIMFLFIIPIGNFIVYLVSILLHKEILYSVFLSNSDSIIYKYTVICNSVNQVHITVLGTWMVGIVLVTLKNIICYQRFRYIILSSKKFASRKMHEIATTSALNNNITMPIKIYVNENLNTPMLIGFFSPIIVLPSDNLDIKNAEYILSHELIHYKQKDLILKFSMMLIRTIHWFNPLVYLMSLKLEKWCEYSCDEKNAVDLSHEKKKKYGLAILETAAMMPVYTSNFGTPFHASKQDLKERLMFMLDVKKINKKIILLSFVFVVIFINIGLSIAFVADLFNGGIRLNYSSQENLSYYNIMYEDNNLKVPMDNEIQSK